MKKLKFMAALLGAALLVACKDDKPEVADYTPYTLTDGSTAKWKGTIVGGPSNEGTVSVIGGGFYVADGRVIGGEVKISVASISVTNNLSPAEKALLVNHLKSSDFFNLAVHPNVTYTIVSADKLATPDTEGNNYKIYGTMTLLGNTQQLQIPAKINLASNKITIKSSFKFDRTKWGMTYASVTPPPNGGLIEKDVEVNIDLTAEKN